MNKNWLKVMQASSREKREICLYASPFLSQQPLNTLILGLFHGDEPESYQLVSYFLSNISPYDFGNTRVGIVPAVNPDGYARNQRVNAAGVDINRNFPTADWKQEGIKTAYYSGPHAASEPETCFILNILKNYSPQKIITVHTPYRVINYDGPAKNLAEAMSRVNCYPVTEDIGYSTPGSFGTYAGKERNIAVITLELPEANFDEEAVNINILALKTAIEWS